MTHLEWTPAPDLAAKLGDEHWPLLDYLLDPPQATEHDMKTRAIVNRDSPDRRAALEALIQVAFGR